MEFPASHNPLRENVFPVKSALRSLFENFLVLSGVHHLFRWLNRRKILILMYHGVSKAPFPMVCWWQLPYEQFRTQLQYLKMHYTVLHLSDAVKRLKERQPLPTNTAVITFDDGYRNNLTTALPLLNNEHLPATIFLTTGFIGSDALLWPDDLYLRFSRRNRVEEFHDALESLKAMSADKKQVALRRLQAEMPIDSGGASIKDEFRLLAWNEVAMMHKGGLIEFGAHSVHHEILSRLRPEDMADEVRTSCNAIHGRLGTAAVMFAYPNGREGDFNPEVKNELEKANVCCSVSTIYGLNDGTADLFALKRVGVGADMTIATFKLMTSGFIGWMKALLRQAEHA